MKNNPTEWLTMKTTTAEIKHSVERLTEIRGWRENLGIGRQTWKKSHGWQHREEAQETSSRDERLHWEGAQRGYRMHRRSWPACSRASETPSGVRAALQMGTHCPQAVPPGTSPGGPPGRGILGPSLSCAAFSRRDSKSTSHSLRWCNSFLSPLWVAVPRVPPEC